MHKKGNPERHIKCNQSETKLENMIIYIDYAKSHFYKLPFTAKDTGTSAVIARDLNRGRSIGTKLNYVCLLRNYFNYCIVHGEDPSKKVIDPIVAIH